MKRKILPIIVFCLSAASVVDAQEPQVPRMKPEQQKQLMQQQMQMMVPMFGHMMKIMMTAQFEVLSQPETAEKLAAYTRNFYEALIQKGFSKKEALEIAMNIGVPSAPMMGK